MRIQRTLICDIETAPLSKEELEEYGKRFPKKPHAKMYKLDKPGLYWTTGQVVCVGLKECDDEEVVICTGDEYKTLIEAHEIMKDYQDFFVTFNGDQFDLKFLTGRAWKHLIPMKLPTGKYQKNHCDIYQVLGGSWGSTKVSLEELAHHFGVYDDLWGHGYEVEKWWQDKDFDSIKRHCSGDINTTYKIYHGFIKEMYRQV